MERDGYNSWGSVYLLTQLHRHDRFPFSRLRAAIDGSIDSHTATNPNFPSILSLSLFYAIPRDVPARFDRIGELSQANETAIFDTGLRAAYRNAAVGGYSWQERFRFIESCTRLVVLS